MGGREMRVLVVEDNPELGANLRQGLREHGFAVDLIAEGKAALNTRPPGSTTC